MNKERRKLLIELRESVNSHILNKIKEVQEFLKGETDYWWAIQDILISFSDHGCKFKIIKTEPVPTEKCTDFDDCSKRVDFNKEECKNCEDNFSYNFKEYNLGLFEASDIETYEDKITFDEANKTPCISYSIVLIHPEDKNENIQ